MINSLSINIRDEFRSQSIKKKEINLTTDLQRNNFTHLISTQRTLLNSALQEPSVWWFNYAFSSERYNTLIKEQVDMFRMLHNMHTAVSKIDRDDDLMIRFLIFMIVNAY
jgi:hypothetical protein